MKPGREDRTECRERRHSFANVSRVLILTKGVPKVWSSFVVAYAPLGCKPAVDLIVPF